MTHPHVSQLYDHGAGSVDGGNDCFEASLARYLRESGYPFGGSDQELIGRLRARITGVPDGPRNPYTSCADAESYLRRLGVLQYVAASSPRDAVQPWTISLVRGVRLLPRQYPAGWFGNRDEPDHFILVLPGTPGGGVPCNDPLAYWNGQDDCRYTTLPWAVEGGVSYRLIDPAHLTWRASGPDHYVAVPKAIIAAKPAPKPLPKPAPAPAHVTPRQLANIRKAPSIKADKVHQVPAGTALAVLSEADENGHQTAPWYPVLIPGTNEVGWISHVVL